ncbi:MAG: phosphoribosylpyrophosphate synthetase [Sneathiella sp.]|jgi:ribose-phosphate pyrophosphokinase|uniref:ribose-phosphate diphosphokinase n=1 Tax=Sneathiella sp. TaxID=1964365 RepID=UPI000C63FFD6|nr:ribose-phosphate diphosphokinase [Sneathiella sp.]MAL77988.1 phosphoribosylpyrophosphate synthetase [Sneathiella sp.]
MKTVSLHFLPGYREIAKGLSMSLGVDAYPIEIHKFPDGESKVRVEPSTGTVVIYASLDHPNEKLLHLALAAATFRELGANRLVLVAPYLCYMRQDIAFTPGEAVSQRLIGQYLARYFDRVVTVDPHLHRIDNLQDVFGNCRADALTATGVIAETLSKEDLTEVILAGPDAESEQWVKAIATPLSLPYLIGAKRRSGDREVAVEFPEGGDLAGRRIILLDDVMSSGMTICEAVKTLKARGAGNIDVITVHMLARREDLEAVRASGVQRIRATDSIAHETSDIPLHELLLVPLREELSR